MKQLFYFAFISALFSCREFYDEEFEDGENNVVILENATYTADLRSTDSSLTNMTGTGVVDLQDGNVNVTIDLAGIPQNIIQVHYGYSGADCSDLAFTFPVELGDTRTYNISENLTSNALTFDIRNSGADGTNLQGKSLIIKAYTSLSSESSPAGVAYTIACGELSNSADPTVTPVPDEEAPAASD